MVELLFDIRSAFRIQIHLGLALPKFTWIECHYQKRTKLQILGAHNVREPKQSPSLNPKSRTQFYLCRLQYTQPNAKFIRSLYFASSMEALASSAFVPETHPVLHNPTSIRTPNKRSGFLKISQSSHFVGLRVQALSGEASGSGDSEEGRPLNNGFGLVSEEILSLSQVCVFQLSTYACLYINLQLCVHFLLFIVLINPVWLLCSCGHWKCVEIEC